MTKFYKSCNLPPPKIPKITLVPVKGLVTWKKVKHRTPVPAVIHEVKHKAPHLCIISVRNIGRALFAAVFYPL